MSNVTLPEIHNTKEMKGSVSFIIKDKLGNVIDVLEDHNIIKIGMKEVIPHRITPPRVWDPIGGTGAGDWVDIGIDIDEFVPRYIWFGASFDDNNQPIGTSDTRFYYYDSTTNSFKPNQLSPGAAFNGGLINPIPIADPDRPLKRIERVFFEPSYQPAGNPLNNDDVRAINNIMFIETTLRLDEYNGFGNSTNDYFDISEVALVAAREVDLPGACECDPRVIFRQGQTNQIPLIATANGTDTISLTSEMSSYATLIKEGDQIQIVASGGTSDAEGIGTQPNDFYMVISKSTGGHDLTLDRIPTSLGNVPISGTIGVYREGHKIVAHRITSPIIRKNSAFTVTCRWKIIIG